MSTPKGTESVALKRELITTQERDTLEQIAKGEAPHSQRAMALLAINTGKTQEQAAEKTGLSAGQVKYWTAKFRKQRLGIFPNDLQDKQDTKDGEESKTGFTVELKPKTDKVDFAKVKSKDKKDEKGKKEKKKGKKSKKAKKSKKVKKDKKDKKSKKKNKKTKKDKKNK